jgi:ABC-type nitrate/sulfonate/bicarbonate transport system substrate-binding protein
MSKLRGGRIGMREKEGLVQTFITDALREAGVDPETEVQWVYDPVFGYRNNPNHMERLRSGKIEAITSQPPFSDQLEKEGYPMILDPNTVFPRRPGKLTVATEQMIEKRGDELRAYFRAIIRSFWFMRDVKNFEYLRDLEKNSEDPTPTTKTSAVWSPSSPRPTGWKAGRCPSTAASPRKLCNESPTTW